MRLKKLPKKQRQKRPRPWPELFLMSLSKTQRLLLALTLALAGMLTPGFAQAPPSAGTEDARIADELQARVKQYLDLRQKAGGKLPGPDNVSAHIVSRQRELADKVRVVRAGAKQGEVFTPEIVQYFRRQIAASLAGRHGHKIRSSLRHAEPVNIQLQINQSYPDRVPLQSTPPTLLLNLPQLADGMEYRILGRQLVLRDSEANIIVDYIPEALPDIRK
jgi:hypothetical protein